MCHEKERRVSRLTHKWHRPWTCRRRSEQWRIPGDLNEQNSHEDGRQNEISYRFNLTRVNLNDPNASSNELLSQAFSEASDSGLGGAVD